MCTSIHVRWGDGGIFVAYVMQTVMIRTVGCIYIYGINCFLGDDLYEYIYIYKFGFS